MNWRVLEDGRDRPVDMDRLQLMTHGFGGKEYLVEHFQGFVLF